MKRLASRWRVEEALDHLSRRTGEVLRFPRVHHHPVTDSDRPGMFQSHPLNLPDSCPACSANAADAGYSDNGVCSQCSHHLRIPARARITLLVDPDTFVEDDEEIVGDDPLGFTDTRPYPERVRDARTQTGLSEAILTGRARIGSHAVAIAAFEFAFLGGTMGVAVGEKLVRLFERATEARYPVIVITSSGGARMQEGTLALAQMARVAAAVERHHAEGLLYISVLADPTTGGVMVSPGSMGDIVLAEPGAYAAFAGRRVSGVAEPMGAEWLQAHGMVDGVVTRTELRDRLIDLLSLLTRRNLPLPRTLSARTLPQGKVRRPRSTATEVLKLVRSEDRPAALDYITRLTDHFVELHGDRLFADDEVIIGGVGNFAGQSVVFLGQDRHRPARESTRAGMPYPEGFRKVLRLALIAAKFNLPVITLIDTPGAKADAETESRGLAFAIGRCLRVFSALPVPIIAAIIGEGNSGAAIALAAGDALLMQEHAVFEVIRPEGAAAILYRDVNEAAALAEHMHITAWDAYEMGVIDGVVPEPTGGANSDPDLAAHILFRYLVDALAEAQRWLPARLVQQRYHRIRSLGERGIAAGARGQHEAGESSLSAP